MWEFAGSQIPISWRGTLQHVAYALWGSVAFVAVGFTGRGLAGAFQQELSTLAVCVSVFIAACVCLAALGCFRSALSDGLSQNQTQLAFALTVLPPTLLGIVLCPASSILGIGWITIWGIGLSISVQWVAQPTETSQPFQASSEIEGRAETAPILSGSPATLEEPDLTQWMTRRDILAEGEEWEQIEGQVTVEFAAGQQHATMHISICPPLSSTPEIECETRGGTQVEWKVTAVHPYGVRLELRRPAPLSVPLSVAVGYTMAAIRQTNVAKAA